MLFWRISYKIKRSLGHIPQGLVERTLWVAQQSSSLAATMIIPGPLFLGSAEVGGSSWPSQSRATPFKVLRHQGCLELVPEALITVSPRKSLEMASKQVLKRLLQWVPRSFQCPGTLPAPYIHSQWLSALTCYLHLHSKSVQESMLMGPRQAHTICIGIFPPSSWQLRVGNITIQTALCVWKENYGFSECSWCASE